MGGESNLRFGISKRMAQFVWTVVRRIAPFELICNVVCKIHLVYWEQFRRIEGTILAAGGSVRAQGLVMAKREKISVCPTDRDEF